MDDADKLAHSFLQRYFCMENYSHAQWDQRHFEFAMEFKAPAFSSCILLIEEFYGFD